MPDVEDLDSESVEELAEEGTPMKPMRFLASKTLRIDFSEVTTHEVTEDDVPAEYLPDEDEHIA